MERVHTIRIEPLTEEGLRPFGQIVGDTGKPPTLQGAATKAWRIDFGIDGTPEVLFARFDFQPWKVHRMERHLNVAQSFSPLDGKPSIMVVAPPTDPNDWDAIPAPEELRAFLLDGSRGIMLGEGTWHALHRFPLYPPSAEFAVLTALETTEELVKAAAGGPATKLTQIADYRERFGITFELSW